VRALRAVASAGVDVSLDGSRSVLAARCFSLTMTMSNAPRRSSKDVTPVRWLFTNAFMLSFRCVDWIPPVNTSCV
jgi:hypothetical protein